MNGKVMILGAEGQTGRELCNMMDNPIKVSHADKTGNIRVEFKTPGESRKLILSKSPDIIVNTVALTNVDKCDKDMESAYRINASAVREISQAAGDIGAKLVHISTDYVFDGKNGNYKEISTPNPINYYGLSKLLGDCYAESASNSIIVRTSGVYGYSKNYPVFVYESLKAGKKISAIKGYYSPIHAYNLAKAVKELIEIEYTGLINIAGEKVSRYELAQKIAHNFSLKGQIEEIESSANLTAMRPFDSSLNIEKAQSFLNFDFSSLESNMRAFEQRLEK